MKKKLLITIAALALIVSAAGCGQKNANTTQDNNTAQTETSQNSGADVSDNYAEGASENVDMNKIDGTELKSESDSEASATLEESAVSIEDAKLVEVDDRQLVVVSYKFTNKSDSEESFTSLMKTEVYQDGLTVNPAIGQYDIEGFDPNSTAERVKPGKTVTVQEIYSLVNDAPVEVVVSEFHGTTNAMVTKTFDLQ
jgi:uncharacterized protein YxeA